jgi:hypothetical protein
VLTVIAMSAKHARDGSAVVRRRGASRNARRVTEDRHRVVAASVASNWKLVWWRFRKHHLALVCAAS